MKLHPGYEGRPQDPMFVDCIETPLTEEQATYYLKTAWKNIYGEMPAINSLALLWAQSAGETGRWKMLRNNNWGNIKKRDGVKYTSYLAGEIIKGKQQLFYPYHPQTFFVALDTPLEGAEFYIKFLSSKSRYKKAWEQLILGDPVGYCRELKAGGYFTADLEHYTKGVISLTNEFKKKIDKLMSWESEPEFEPEPLPEIEIEPEPEPELETEIEIEPVPESEHDIILDLEPKSSIKNNTKESIISMIFNLLAKLFKKN